MVRYLVSSKVVDSPNSFINGCSVTASFRCLWLGTIQLSLIQSYWCACWMNCLLHFFSECYSKQKYTKVQYEKYYDKKVNI